MSDRNEQFPTKPNLLLNIYFWLKGFFFFLFFFLVACSDSVDVFIFFTLCNSCHARESFGKSWTDGCMACCEFCYTDLPLNNPKKMRAFNSIKPMVTLNPPASHIQNDHSLCSWTHSFPSHSFSFGEGSCTYFISFFFFIIKAAFFFVLGSIFQKEILHALQKLKSHSSGTDLDRSSDLTETFR